MPTKKEKIYDDKIYPLMGQIIKICKKHKINIAATFSLGKDKEHDNEELNCSTIINFDNNALIEKCAKVIQHGYGVVPPFIAMTIRKE